MSTRVLTDFDLLLPASLEEALDILQREGAAVTVVSGGTDVLGMMKAGFKTDKVMSLALLPDLSYLEYNESSGLRMGARNSIRTHPALPQLERVTSWTRSRKPIRNGE